LRRAVAEKEAERAAAIAQADDLKEKLAAAFNLDTVRQERDAALAARAALETELAALKSAAAQTPALAALQQENQTLRAASEATHVQFDRLHARLSDADQLRRDLNAAHSAKAAAESELAALRERFAHVAPADQLAALKVELARASSERDMAREHAQSLQARLAETGQIRVDLDTARTLKAAADTQAAEHRTMAETRGAQLARVTGERDSALRQVDALQTQLDAALSLAAARQDRDAAVAARNALESELAALRGQIASAPRRDELEILRRQLTELEAKRTQAMQEARDLRTQLDSLPDVSELERTRDAALADRARLAQMLESLRAQLSVAPASSEWRQPLMLTPREPIREEPAPIEPAGFRASYLAALSPDRLGEELRRAGAGVKPISLVEPLTRARDDLQAISGLTPSIERWLHSQGLFFFWQVATLDAPSAAWLELHMPADAGVTMIREQWIAQAARLVRI
jgi:predicted flap endonuclease-1-like 5' DNA nuclease/DNA repair exonuclease SbcCD ATPase subunit